MYKIWTAAVAFLLSLGSAAAQPFGISEGTAIESLTVTKKIAPFIFGISPQKTHPEFEVYTVRATPKTGVCQINAIGKDYGNDRYGTKVRDSFDRLRAQLSTQYGNSTKVDFIRNGALWKDSNEWVASIHNNERTLQSVWDASTGATLSKDVTEILLGVSASSHSTSYLVLQYRFRNYTSCKQEMDNAGSDAL